VEHHVTALPIDPTDEQITEWARALTGGNGSADYIRAAHQAGVEAERARAAAEATVEWGVQLILDENRKSHVIPMDSADEAKNACRKVSDYYVVRRTVAGPWEVQP
jgi:hypothetical protein